VADFFPDEVQQALMQLVPAGRIVLTGTSLHFVDRFPARFDQAVTWEAIWARRAFVADVWYARLGEYVPGTRAAGAVPPFRPDAEPGLAPLLAAASQTDHSGLLADQEPKSTDLDDPLLSGFVSTPATGEPESPAGADRLQPPEPSSYPLTGQPDRAPAPPVLPLAAKRRLTWPDWLFIGLLIAALVVIVIGRLTSSDMTYHGAQTGVPASIAAIVTVATPIAWFIAFVTFMAWFVVFMWRFRRARRPRPPKIKPPDLR